MSKNLSQRPKNSAWVAIAILFLFGWNNHAFGQLVKWNPSTLSGTFGPSPWTPALLNPSLTTSGLIRGSSLATSGSPAGGCYGSSGGWSSGGGEANSFYFSVTASCDVMSLTTISGRTRRSNTGPASCNLYYSINGGAYVYFDMWTTSTTSGTSGSVGSSTLSGISALQNLPAGTVVKIKFTPNGTTGNYYFTNNFLQLDGTLVAVPTPTIATPPVNSAIAVGAGTTFTVSGVTDAASYQWQRNTSGTSGGTWVNITSATMDPTGTYAGYAITSTGTTSTLTLASVPASWDGYAYRCVVTNCAGNATSIPATLNVSTASCSGAPTGGTATAAATNFCTSGSTTISLSGGSTGSGLTYQWSSSNTNTPPGTAISGATNSYYNTGTLTDTTYFWCTTTCTTSSLSDISSAAVVNINPLPTVSATGGTYCTGTGGLTVTASGADTYSWSPATGLSATTGDTLTSIPPYDLTYTVTGTSAAGCTNTATASVHYVVGPSSLTITPTTLTACAGSSAVAMNVSGGTAGPSVVNSGVISIPTSIGAYGTIANSQTVAGVPAGATITGASVKIISFGANYQADYVVNITAPNGNTLNLIKNRGTATSTVTTLFSNTEISSTGSTSFASGSGAYTGTWAADANTAVGGAPYASNVTDWASLLGTPNGNWTLSIYNSTTYTNTVISSARWELALQYSYQGAIYWTPVTDLYTDAAATVAYTGTPSPSIYFNPATAGTSTITATANIGGCTSSVNTIATVNALPANITGTFNVCVGQNTTLANTTTGGTWSVSNANATIDATTGVLTGASAGTTTVTYTLPTGCYTTTVATVNSMPAAIGGIGAICEAATATLTNTMTGGTWSVSGTHATINASTGVITGVSAGTATVTYTLTGGCYNTAVETVNAAPAGIMGSTNVCEGSTTTMTNTITGGTWAISGGHATIDASTGVVTAISAGTADITYTLAGGCAAYKNITVDALPSAISGATSICQTQSTTLSSTPTGGTWGASNSNASITSSTGYMTGSTAGTTIITYTAPNTCRVTMIETVLATPASIWGPSQVCEGDDITLVNITGGGTWSVSNANATIGTSSGILHGVTAGNVFVTYTTSNGCHSETPIMVNALPSAISGNPGLCIGSSNTFSATPTIGGTWSSSNSNISIGSTTGIGMGMTVGTSVLTYTLPSGCISTIMATVNSIPATISSIPNICVGFTETYTDATIGGTWTSSNPIIAMANSTTGQISGVNAGTAIISYSLGSGCTVTTPVTVNALPPAITSSTTNFCSGTTVTLSNADASGSWSTLSSIATVDATGIVTGLAGGTATITYTIPSGCYTTKMVNILQSPQPITGVSSICTGRTTVLYSITAGGVFSSNNTLVASIGSLTGITNGLSSGTVTISYVLPTGCFATKLMTVNPNPTAITGNGNICLGSTNIYADTMAGGSWSSADPIIATIDATTGGATGINPGIATISYTMGATGCYVLRTVSVNTLPSVYTVTGGGNYCTGSTGASVGLSGSETGVTYTLYNGGSTIATAAGTSLPLTFGSFSAAGAYTVSASNSAGCTVDMTGATTVTSLPLTLPLISMTAAPGDTVCEGSAITYNTTVADEGTTPVYEWRVNGSAVGAGTTYTYVPTNGDIVYVRLTSNADCRISDTANAVQTVHVVATVNPAVTTGVTPNDTVCAHTPVTHVAFGAATGTAPVYVWYLNGMAASTGTNYTFIPTSHDVVSCMMVSNAQCRTEDTVYSAPIIMEVLAELNPTVSISTSPSTTVVAGETVTFTASATNAGTAPTYQWSVNGVAVAGANTATFSANYLSDNDAVTCEVTSHGQCGGLTTASTVIVTVMPGTGIAINEQHKEMHLVPNPATSRFVIAGSGSLNGTLIQVQIVDMTGREVIAYSVANNGTDVMIEAPATLSAGMYIVTVTDGTATSRLQLQLMR